MTGRGNGRIFMKILRIVAPMTLGLLLQGCAAGAIGITLATAGAGAGMTAGVEHTLNGIVYKTFASPANEVRFATLKTLDRMGMPLTDDQKTDTGWKLSASAKDRTVDIELESLTDMTTRIRVVANEGFIFLKDDKNGFPAFNAAPLVRNATIAKYSDIPSVLNPLAPKLTTDASIQLQTQVSQVRSGGASANAAIRTVATNFLKTQKLL